ncbi:hypothetical protein N9D31_00935 [Oligoflexaceae bacterium]|nr:hypothetical protein [Oligoflexaceae bacterium]
MRFRLATSSDVFPIISIFQKSGLKLFSDAIFSDYKRLEAHIKKPESLWVLTEIEGSLKAVVSILLEEPEGIAKVTRMFVDRDRNDANEILRESLRYCLHYLEHLKIDLEMVYSSTMSMTREQQELTLNEGFKILGIFPNALGQDNTMLNGLTGFYFKDVLEKKRVQNFKLHPAVGPFFEISRKHYSLPSLEVASSDEVSELVGGFRASITEKKSPVLEMIQARRWVESRFQKLRANHSQVINFYPFYNPNAVITSSKGDVEIYLKISSNSGFCAIIGERMTRAVDPVAMYKNVLTLLEDNSVSYVEIINDAADIYGAECIINAGFTPCAYVPAFKRQGKKRRDYVVYGKSFKYLCRPASDSYPEYLEFYREYFKIEGKNYFPEFLLQDMKRD